MSDRTKMYLKLAGFLGVCVLLGYGLFLLFFGGAPDVDEVPADTPTVGGLSGAGDAGDRATTDDTDTDTTDDADVLPEADAVASGGATITRRLTNTDVLAPTLTSDGTMAYYDPADGRFYTIADNGTVTALSAARFPDASNVTMADDATAAVIEFPDGSNVAYSFTSGRQVTLPTHWEDFDFSSDGSQIASKSIGSDSSNRSLVISSTDGTQTKVIAALGDNSGKVDVSVSPSGNVVAFSRTGSVQTGFGRSEYYLIDQNGDAAGNLIVDGSNFSAIWSPDGQYVLYSVADSGNADRPTLWYVDSRGDRHGTTRVQIELETWVEKCTFESATTLYCAVPQEMADGGGADHRLVDAPDNLYRVSLPSGRATLLGYAAAEMQMFNLSVNGDTLYFQDGNGRINSMEIR